MSASAAVRRVPQSGGTTDTGRMLLVLLTGVFVAQFDFFVVNVAAPSISGDLHASATSLELVVGGYAFAYASAMVTSGRLGDMLGHRRMFAVGMAAFALTSLLCGITTTAPQLIAARLAQGIAGAVMVPQTMGMITTEFPVEKRAKGLAGWGMAAGLGSILGQVLGGLLVQADVAGLGWRLIFLVNVPICTAAALVAPRLLPAPSARRRSELDVLGATGTSLALALLLIPLTLGRSQGWPTWIWLSIGGSVAVGMATLRWQRALARRGGQPVIDMALFASPSFRAGLIAGACFMLYFGSFMFTLTLLLQGGLGLNPWQAGLVFCPMGVLFSLGSLAGPRLRNRYGPTVLFLGSLVSAAGLLALALLLRFGGTAAGAVPIALCLCLIGFGNGVVLPALIGTALSQVQPRQAGVANGVLQTNQQFSSSAGVAVLGALFFGVLGDHPGRSGYAHAMALSAAVDVVLVLAVSAMVWRFKRLAESS